MIKPKVDIPWTKIVIEFFSIVFAVFMALAVDQWKENSKNRDLANHAMKNLYIETQKNYDSLLVSHANFNTKIKEIDSLILLINKKSHNIKLPEYQFMMPTKTAWEAAKLTQALNYMDFEMVGEVSELYNSQDIYVNIVQKVLDELFFAGNVNSYEKAGDLLKRHKYLFSNINYIETQLLDDYSKFLKKYSNFKYL